MEDYNEKIEEVIGKKPFTEMGLKFVGSGADKIVFETFGSKRKLVKVSMHTLEQKIFDLLNEGSIDRKINEKNQKDEISEQEVYEKDIIEVFGPEHFLRKGKFRTNIPLTKEVISKFASDRIKLLLDKLQNDIVYEVEMIAETQLIASELKDPEKFNTMSFNTSLIINDEFRSASDIPEGLSRIRTLVDENFLTKFDPKKYPDNKEIRETIDIVKEIIEKIIKYSKMTGLMIDIFGRNNITIFTKTDGALDYHLLDSVLPGSQKEWRVNIKDDSELKLLRHYYTFYYSIKSLADNLGIADNLKLEDLCYFKDARIPTGKFPTTKPGR